MRTAYPHICNPIAIFIAILHMSVPLIAQENASSVVIGDRIEINSAVLNERREILVGKPSGYDSGDDNYPVLYLLDGESNFHHVTGLTKFLARDQQIPEILVVGIPNTDRDRDLTPISTVARERGEFPTQGGANDFLRFLKDELAPFVDENYRTKPYKILVGHSFGGLFTIYSLLNEPDHFNAYISLSPSLQWNNQSLLTDFQEYFSRPNDLVADLYIAKGNESPALLPGFPSISSTLNNVEFDGFRWKTEELSTESHNSIPYRGVHRGLEFIFEDWVLEDYMSIFNENGLSGLTDAYRQGGLRFGYDRTLPPNTILSVFGILGSSGRLEEAAEVLTYYETVSQPQAFLYEVLGDGFLGKGQVENAISYYREAMRLDPGNENYASIIVDLEARN